VSSTQPATPPRRGLLDLIERIGNLLPDPAILFVAGALLVMVLSQVGQWQGWSVQPKRLVQVMEVATDEAGAPIIDPQTGQAMMRPVIGSNGRPQTRLEDRPEAPITARGLLSADGLYYAISSMVDNFIRFPPLGVVLVGMLGIGVAERSGFIGAALKAFMYAVPARLLTPAVVFLGVMSSLATDAGYVVLPPVAAALYKAAGRSPLAGIAAVFAGVAAGFNANLLITSLDPLLANLTGLAAATIEPGRSVSPTCNWYFMAVSTVLITFVGWGVSAVFVERRLSAKPAEEGGPSPVDAADAAAGRLVPAEVRGLLWATAAVLIATGVFIAFSLVPGMPFDDAKGKLPDAVRGLGLGDHFDRWVEAIVPMLFILFLLPGIVYGLAKGSIRKGADVPRMMVETMAAMAPIIVLAFFAAQFIDYFRYSNLDKMLAYTGGEWLASADLGPSALIIAFILLTMAFNILISSMSAKYTMFAPIFVPMLMLVGISPELTQAAYRIGDSTTNIITPLNAYLVIILVVMQKYAPRAGIGTVISMMLPYSIVFTIAWMALLLGWMALGAPLGPEGPLWYTPAAG
jgi:aminobenzoyl-glutamate transport protein